MASTTLAEISRLDFLDFSIPPLASVTDVKHLSSYNWIEAPTPTIAVPGSPSLWSAPRAPQQLKKDSGLIYIAQNAARHPESPLEPLFRALFIANPSFDIRSTDIVTDRNNIRKLLSFINPGSSRNGLEAFTINIEIAKNTAIFSRTEPVTYEVIKPHEFKGFGHEFEKAYTTSQVSDSTGHHRIISYSFSDLKLIVRYEADGYVDAGTGGPSSHNKERETDSLSNMLGSLSLSQTSSPSKTTPNPPSKKTTPAGSKLTITEEGQVIPHDSTLEIKTRVMHKPLEIQEIAAQLWVSQTSKLVRAYHFKGVFQRPNVEDVAVQIKRWEDTNQSDLRKLAALITKILHVVRGCDCGHATLRYDVQRDKLIVAKADGAKKVLPKDLYSKWDGDPKTTITEEHDVGDRNAGKFFHAVRAKAEGKKKSLVLGLGSTKGKTVVEAAAKEREEQKSAQADQSPNPARAKDEESSSKDNGVRESSR